MNSLRLAHSLSMVYSGVTSHKGVAMKVQEIARDLRDDANETVRQIDLLEQSGNVTADDYLRGIHALTSLLSLSVSATLEALSECNSIGKELN